MFTKNKIGKKKSIAFKILYEPSLVLFFKRTVTQDFTLCEIKRATDHGELIALKTMVSLFFSVICFTNLN